MLTFVGTCIHIFEIGFYWFDLRNSKICFHLDFKNLVFKVSYFYLIKNIVDFYNYKMYSLNIDLIYNSSD